LNKSTGYPGCSDFSAEKISLDLKNGDRFIIFSGSLPRLKNNNARELGLAGIIRYIENCKLTRGELIDSLLAYAYNYTGRVERRKDLSVVSFTISGKG